MEQRAFGSTGLSVSALGFGCGNVGGLMVRGSREQQLAAIRRALEAGVTYFDTAPGYGNGLSEQNLGAALTELGAWDNVVVGTKLRLTLEDLLDPPGAIRRSVVASLEYLGRHTIDLVQLHNPLQEAVDPTGARVATEQLDAIEHGMKTLIREGLVQHIGFTGIGETAVLRETAASGRFESMQAYFNAINPSAGYAGKNGDGQDLEGVIDIASGAGLGVIAIRVMAGGAMTGQEQRAALAGNVGQPLLPGNAYETDISRAARLDALAQELELESALELSLRLVLTKPGVSTALVGYSSLEHLEDALRWATRGPLSPDQLQRVLAEA